MKKTAPQSLLLCLTLAIGLSAVPIQASQGWGSWFGRHWGKALASAVILGAGLLIYRYRVWQKAISREDSMGRDEKTAQDWINLLNPCVNPDDASALKTTLAGHDVNNDMVLRDGIVNVLRDALCQGKPNCVQCLLDTIPGLVVAPNCIEMRGAHEGIAIISAGDGTMRINHGWQSAISTKIFGATWSSERRYGGMSLPISNEKVLEICRNKMNRGVQIEDLGTAPLMPSAASSSAASTALVASSSSSSLSSAATTSSAASSTSSSSLPRMDSVDYP